MTKLMATLLLATALPGVATAQEHRDGGRGGDHAQGARPAPSAPQFHPQAPAFQPRPAPFQPRVGGQPQPFQSRPFGDPRRFDGAQPFSGAQRFDGGRRNFGQQPPAVTGGDPRRFDGQPFGDARRFDGGRFAPDGHGRHLDPRDGDRAPGFQPGSGEAYGGTPNRDPFRADGYRGAQPFVAAPRGGFGYRPDHDRGGWDRGWRGDRRYDWGSYRRYNGELFRLPRYAAPYGWNYGCRRFAVGVVLDELLWAPDYWIDDPYEYRLPPVDGAYRWVRYYNDALLVDMDTGEVVDVVYGIFQ